jgi:hypothetical protein
MCHSIYDHENGNDKNYLNKKRQFNSIKDKRRERRAEEEKAEEETERRGERKGGEENVRSFPYSLRSLPSLFLAFLFLYLKNKRDIPGK